VWLLSSVPKLSRYVTNDEEQELILRTVYREANRHDMDPDLVMAVMQVESRFDRFAVSSAGAQGLIQVMPFWRKEIGRPQDNLTQIETNVPYATAILDDLAWSQHWGRGFGARLYRRTSEDEYLDGFAMNGMARPWLTAERRRPFFLYLRYGDIALGKGYCGGAWNAPVTSDRCSRFNGRLTLPTRPTTVAKPDCIELLDGTVIPILYEDRTVLAALSQLLTRLRVSKHSFQLPRG
jgi:hypothetical protein